MAINLRGTGVALVTPFRNNQVDYLGLERLIEHNIAGGVEFLVTMGTTGESVTLSKKEKLEVMDFTIRTAAGRVGIVAGFGGYNTAEVIEQMQSYHFEGVDAILSVSPAYNKPTQEGIFRHFMALAEATPRPIILYNVPGRTGSNMSAETTLRLAKASDKFIAVKEASGNMRQCMEIIYGRPDGFIVLSGDDNITLPLIACGAEGVVSVVGNAYPREFSEMTRSALAGDYETAKKLHYKLLHLIDLLFVDGNPGGIKANLEILGICTSEVRLPLAPVSEKTYEELRKVAERIAALQ
jgi:4-hydroxy-tetrahydrodipicolinate synthase